MFRKKKFWIVFTALAVVLGSAFAYFRFTRPENQEAETAPLQTAVVRQGDILVSASAAGTLIPAAQVDVSFKSGGLLTGIYVSVGDEVEKGQLLAQLDAQSALIQFGQAERTLLELTSPAAIALAKQNVAQAQQDVDSAIATLKYLISPTVYYWEGKVAEAQEALVTAQAEAEGSSSEDAQQAVEDAERLLNTAEASLKSAWYAYEETYLPEYFTYEECTGLGSKRTCVSYISGPSKASIEDARYGLELAEIRLVEAEYLLEALIEGEIPEGATGSGIAELEQAQFNYQIAQTNLDSTQLIAPISGIVTAVNGQVGEMVGSSVIVSIADLSQPLLQIYLDETDFVKIDLDYEVEVIFDIYPDDIFRGHVIRVDPQMVSFEGVPAVSGLVELDDSSAIQDKRLLVGSNASVEVIAGRAEGVLLVPVEALREITAGEYAVFVMEGDEPQLRLVEVGLIDITYAEIISGLELGDEVTTGIVETD